MFCFDCAADGIVIVEEHQAAETLSVGWRMALSCSSKCRGRLWAVA